MGKGDWVVSIILFNNQAELHSSSPRFWGFDVSPPYIIIEGIENLKIFAKEEGHVAEKRKATRPSSFGWECRYSRRANL